MRQTPAHANRRAHSHAWRGDEVGAVAPGRDLPDHGPPGRPCQLRRGLSGRQCRGQAPARRRDDPAYLAGITTRVRLGTAVLLPALRHPVVLAQQLANIDCGRGPWGGRRLSLADYATGTDHEGGNRCRRGPVLAALAL